MKPEQFMTAKGRGVTIYARNPDKKYAYESIGHVVYWAYPPFNVIKIAGVMYSLQPLEEEE